MQYQQCSASDGVFTGKCISILMAYVYLALTLPLDVSVTQLHLGQHIPLLTGFLTNPLVKDRFKDRQMFGKITRKSFKL